MTFTSIGQSAQTAVRLKPNADGIKRGATGSKMLRGNTSAEIGAWLARQTPADMDKAAVSRALSHNVALTVKYDWRFPMGENGERLPSYRIAVGCAVEGTEQDRINARADLLNFTEPADINSIEGWIAELSVISASRKREAFEGALMVDALSSRLCAYPADIVRYALKEHSWKWFPTWDELRKVCDAKYSPRQKMIAALGAPMPKPEPATRTATDEEKARIDALVAELFPDASVEMRKRALEEITKGNCMKGVG